MGRKTVGRGSDSFGPRRMRAGTCCLLVAMECLMLFPGSADAQNITVPFIAGVWEIVRPHHRFDFHLSLLRTSHVPAFDPIGSATTVVWPLSKCSFSQTLHTVTSSTFILLSTSASLFPYRLSPAPIRIDEVDEHYNPLLSSFCTPSENDVSVVMHRRAYNDQRCWFEGQSCGKSIPVSYCRRSCPIYTYFFSYASSTPLSTCQ